MENLSLKLLSGNLRREVVVAIKVLPMNQIYLFASFKNYFGPYA